MGENCDKYGQPGDGTTYKPPNEWDEAFKAILKEPAPPFFGNVIPPFSPIAPPPPAVAAGEIAYLRQLRDTVRATLSAAIDDENDDFKPVLGEVLGLASLPPQTSELLFKVDTAVKHWLMKQKDRFNRARPVQLAPDLNPPFCPGHPSYPSGHASESFALALALIDALDKYPRFHPVLIAAARRIAFNREVAGVHYPSDSVAGTLLAMQLMTELRKDKAYKDAVQLARQELATLLGPPKASRKKNAKKRGRKK